MKKGIIWIVIIVITNGITYNLAKKQFKDVFLEELNQCILETDFKKTTQLEIISVKNGLSLDVYNKSSCFNIDKLEISMEALNNGKIDTVKVDVETYIKPNFKANIIFNEMKFDTILKMNYKVKEISI